MGECGPCPVLASYTLAFALQLRKKHGKTSVRVDLVSLSILEPQPLVYEAGVPTPSPRHSVILLFLACVCYPSFA